MNAVADATIKGCPQLTQVRLLVTMRPLGEREQDTAWVGICAVSNRTLFKSGPHVV